MIGSTGRSRGPTVAAIASVGLAAALAATSGPVRAGAPESPAPGAPASVGSETGVRVQAPFARIYLALRGCTSCAACRDAIRRMAQGSAPGGDVSLPRDAVEVRYEEPESIPLAEVVRGLAKNRLHDLEVVDVLFEAEGTISRRENGDRVFTLRVTNQAFPLAAGLHASLPGEETPVRLEALVTGWRDDDETLGLEARFFEVKRNGTAR
jgi:hypothetical protein